MGLDLTLLPIEPIDLKSPPMFSQTVLQLIRSDNLFFKISEIEQKKGTPVPKGFNTFLCREDVKNEEGEIIFDETHYGETLTTNYGDPLYYIIIKDLLQLSNHVSVIGNYTNKAVWGYLENSLPERRIALMWS